MRFSRAVALVAALTLALAACQADTGATATSAADESEGATNSMQAFCDAAIEVEMTASAGPEVDFEAATEEEIGEAMGDFADRLDPLLDQLEASTPSELEDSVETATSMLRESLETGDPALFDDPAFIDADQAIDQFMLANCDLESVSITGVDYAFEGVPGSFQAGTVAIEFENQGDEVHEMAFIRINDDVDESIEELLELPEEEAMQKTQFVGAAFAAPGETDVTFVDLAPGNYAVLCFIPVGTTSLEALEVDAPPEGPPHFTQGMLAEFTVEG